MPKFCNVLSIQPGNFEAKHVNLTLFKVLFTQSLSDKSVQTNMYIKKAALKKRLLTQPITCLKIT